MDVKERPGLEVTVHLTPATVLLAISLVMVVVGFVWAIRMAAAATPADMPLAQSRSSHSYYLALAASDATHALDACADGYHMASLWEMLDPSNLSYNDALGLTRADSGQGPPSVYQGWVRTGYPNNTGTTPGQANCSSWTSTSGQGTTIALPADWVSGAKDMLVWTAGTASCGSAAYVWCVED